jgi:hypothetical protein
VNCAHKFIQDRPRKGPHFEGEEFEEEDESGEDPVDDEEY